MNVQAVLFGIIDWNTNDCRNWLYNLVKYQSNVFITQIHFLDID